MAVFCLRWCQKNQTFNSFQAVELSLQPGSDDELDVDDYENRNKSVEDEDFAEDVPQVDASPEYETDDVYVDQLTWSPVDECRRNTGSRDKRYKVPPF